MKVTFFGISTQEKRETSAVPKTEDRLRRLTEENKKLIHLVTSLDQQVALLENKLTNGLAQNEEQRQRSRHSSNTGGKQEGIVGLFCGEFLKV